MLLKVMSLRSYIWVEADSLQDPSANDWTGRMLGLLGAWGGADAAEILQRGRLREI